MQKQRAAGDAQYWVRWAHDQGDVVQGAEKPKTIERDDQRPGFVFGPFATRQDADERLQQQNDRCLSYLASRK